MIPQPFIDELLARTDLVELVGRYVKLRKAGANFLGLCPFHGEKTPSFTVSPSKQFFHCFGCGANGNAIGFLIDHAGFGFVDAVEELARQAGLEVPRTTGGTPAPRRDEGVLTALMRAARFYKRRLADSPEAVAYLKGRGISGATAARFALGYAPAGWRPLEAAFADYAAPALVAAGLVIEPEAPAQAGPHERRRYDRFRDRIMFPIRNPRGQVIGFGARVLGSGEPKYLNSPETAVFSKGRELYGLYEGREALRREACAIVVEGYMDVVMLAEQGIGNVVATLGTATTGDHVRKLLRLVDRVVFAFDGDEAGHKAAWRALQNSLPHASDLKRIEFLFLPPEHDPDSFVRANGAAGFTRALEDALPLSRYLLQALAERAEPSSAEGRARMLAEAAPLLDELAAPALRLQLAHALAERVGITRDELAAYLEAGRERQAHAAATPERSSGWPAGNVGGPPFAGRYGEGQFRGGREASWSTQRAGGPDRRWPGRGRMGGGHGAVVRRLGVAVPRPDLERRLRLLAAWRPGLVHEAGDVSFLSAGLAAWFKTLRGLPAGADFDAACVALAAEAAGEVRQAREDAARDPQAVTGLGHDEALAELSDALAQLRQRDLRARIDALVAAGLETEAERLKYQELMALLQRS